MKSTEDRILALTASIAFISALAGLGYLMVGLIGIVKLAQDGLLAS